MSCRFLDESLVFEDWCAATCLNQLLLHHPQASTQPATGIVYMDLRLHRATFLVTG